MDQSDFGMFSFISLKKKPKFQSIFHVLNYVETRKNDPILYQKVIYLNLDRIRLLLETPQMFRMVTGHRYMRMNAYSSQFHTIDR